MHQASPSCVIVCLRLVKLKEFQFQVFVFSRVPKQKIPTGISIHFYNFANSTYRELEYKHKNDSSKIK